MEYDKERQSKTKAFCQLRSWLESTNIPYTSDGYTITIKTTKGESLLIKIEETSENGIKVDVDTINNKDIKKALSQFYHITELAGYGSPYPLIRGEHVKGSYRKTPELVSFRHNEFRRVGNPPTHKILEYKKVYTLAVSHFAGTNFYNCKNLGIEKEDLETHAKVWTCNYIGLYEVQDPAPNENEKRLYSYIQQRLYNHLKIMLTKQKNCGSRIQTEEQEFFPMQDVDEQPQPKAVATKALKERFNNLPVETKISMLNEVLEDPFIQEDTKKAAIRKLTKISKEARV